MAEPLKHQYGLEVPHAIATQIHAVFPEFDGSNFLRLAQEGYETLELMDRARHLSKALAATLPGVFSDALRVLVDSLGPPLADTRSFGMAPFHYLPHVFFVGQFGPTAIRTAPADQQPALFLQCMNAQYELTRRFTAEFSLRPYLLAFTAETLAVLHTWADDPCEHVRRLVSEGSRPRLPWAPRLPHFQQDPAPTLALLEKLKDDPSRYVQRSVANHLNDISKDRPDCFYATLQRWAENPTPPRQWIIRHALRNAIKRGDPEAMALCGLNSTQRPELVASSLNPTWVNLGETVTLSVSLFNPLDTPCLLEIDYTVDYLKANGRYHRKVFKLKRLTLAGHQNCQLQKSFTLRPMTTRTLYPGPHPVGLHINGMHFPIGTFELQISQ